MAKRKILLIDDEQDLCAVFKKHLESGGGFEVATALSGKEGLREAKKNKPDLILLDIMMPVMDGLKVLETLKKDNETVRIPVIMLTALDDDLDKIKAAQLYDEEYITKPVNIDQLKLKIEEVLKRRG